MGTKNIFGFGSVLAVLAEADYCRLWNVLAHDARVPDVCLVINNALCREFICFTILLAGDLSNPAIREFFCR